MQKLNESKQQEKQRQINAFVDAFNSIADNADQNSSGYVMSSDIRSAIVGVKEEQNDCEQVERILKLVIEYGSVMRDIGIKKPIFFIDESIKKILLSPELIDFAGYVSYTRLSSFERRIPGIIGSYNNVYIVGVSYCGVI